MRRRDNRILLNIQAPQLIITGNFSVDDILHFIKVDPSVIKSRSLFQQWQDGEREIERAFLRIPHLDLNDLCARLGCEVITTHHADFTYKLIYRNGEKECVRVEIRHAFGYPRSWSLVAFFNCTYVA